MNVPDTYKNKHVKFAFSVKHVHSVLTDFHTFMAVTLFREVCCNFICV